jgi:hypothetical protein
MTDTMASQNTDLFSWDTLYNDHPMTYIYDLLQSKHQNL